MEYLQFIKQVNICEEKRSIAITFKEKEPYLLDDIINRIKKKYIKDENMDFLEVNASDVDEMEIVNFCNSFSMFSERKVLVIKSANNLSLNSSVLSSIMDSEAIKLFVFDNKKGYYKKISSNSVNVEIDKLQEVILIKWIIKKFSDLNKEISVSSAQYLIKLSSYLAYRSPYSLYDISASIHKISATKEEVITNRVIDKSLAIPTEDNVFKLQELVGKRDLNTSLKVYYELHSNGVEAYSIIPLLTRHFYQLNKVKHLKDNGLSVSQIGEAIGIRRDFVIRKLLHQITYFNTESLLRNLNKCLDTERRCKSEKVNINAEVEMLILELCK